MSALSGTPRPLGSRPLRAVGSCPFVLSSLGCACFEAARCARYWQWQSSTSQATRLAPAPAGAAGWPLATRARPSVRVVPFVWCLCARGGAPDWPPLNFAAWPSVLSLLWFFVLSSLGWVCFEAARSVHWSQCRILGNSQAARLAPARTNVQGRRIGRRWLPVHGCLCRLGGSASRRRGVFAARSGSRVRHRPLDSRPLRAVSIGLAAVELRCVAVCAVVVVVLRAQLARVGLRRDGAVRSLVAVALFGQFAGRSARARPDRRTQRTWDVHTDVSRMPGRGPAPSLDASKCNRRSCSASPVRCRGVVVAVNQPLWSGAPLTADSLKAPHLVAQPSPLRNQREPCQC